MADAQWFRFYANQSHGLRRSKEDKQRAVTAALALEFNASNSTGGAPITMAYPLIAGVPCSLDLPMTRLAGIGSNRVVTLRIALGVSGKVSSAVYFREI